MVSVIHVCLCNKKFFVVLFFCISFLLFWGFLTFVIPAQAGTGSMKFISNNYLPPLRGGVAAQQTGWGGNVEFA